MTATALVNVCWREIERRRGARGRVSGSYTIGTFHNCGLATLLINLTIPGSGNTIALTLSKAKIRG